MKVQLIIILIASLLIGCSQNSLKPGEGFLDVKGGKLWYEISGKGEESPIIILHGGPGYPSYSLSQLTELSSKRPVVMYDQLGCGRSDRITDTSLMTIEAYVEQLRVLIDELDIKEFYLYGHSWGTILGMEYYLAYPNNVKAMILSSPCLNSDLWLQDADTLISNLPDSNQFFLRQSIRNENTDSVRMKESIDLFYNTYYTTRQPLSEDMQKTIDEVGFNIYEYMWGKEDYVLTGTLKGYDITDELHNVNVPTLYLTGEFDAARPVTVRHYQDLTPNSEFHIIKNAGHQTVHDNPKETLRLIDNFLSEIEK